MTRYWISADPDLLGTPVEAPSLEALLDHPTVARSHSEVWTVSWDLMHRPGAAPEDFWMCRSTELRRQVTLTAPRPAAPPAVGPAHAA